MQTHFTSADEINASSIWFRDLIDSNGLSRRSCTEANEHFDVIKGYKMIKLLISKAQFLQLEDICIAFFDYTPNDSEPDRGMSFWENGVPVDAQSRFCSIFLYVALDKPKIETASKGLLLTRFFTILFKGFKAIKRKISVKI